MSVTVVVLLLGIGNFAYQWLFGDSDWLTAAERTSFQAIAIAAYVFLDGMS